MWMASMVNAADFVSALASGAGGVEGGVEVDFDMTVLFMVGLFVILWVALKPLLFDPMLKLFEERERRIDGAKLLARKIDEKSAGALTKYEDEMQKGRASANAEREKIRAEGLKREAEILARVRAATTKTLEDGRKQMQLEMAQAKAGLDTEMAGIASDFASRALGREVRG
jgi:F-type H+-transporting ATPase subunit b